MDTEEKFVFISGLLCEPTRARMLWNLLDGRAYTATELATAADISTTSASNHLSRLLEADILKVETQGRHRYYNFFSSEVAYVVESLANLAKADRSTKSPNAAPGKGIHYCRTCYDHMAGYVGVQITEAMETKDYLQKSDSVYLVTEKGWEWLSQFSITADSLPATRRPLTRQCLDWSERRPHLAGQLGALLLEKMLQKGWFRKVQFSRELIVTSHGAQSLYEILGITLQ
ncbi:winged helix-turn-helix domain-containing protein [Xanthocytophaga agilis]|uniref:Winged helix-turn-helix domain-containing protein n=1 Tax=Xanthocytophaga agilis TaxID=3048010 RepID=A0AAE3RBD6_9BACT|nr:winged helix-turn-helix domain-containing protein [Xanthocytophaga agilis]MDJ1504919.1 winged helix-turn-helix domain-containing protein [Xanthocytophaga agilis]